MRYLRITTVLLLILGSLCCGGTSEPFDPSVPTQMDPFISSINPTTATAGDTVTILGYGFSDASELNVVFIGATDTLADAGSYSLVVPQTVATEIESITFTVPAGITPGSYSVYLLVLTNPSNDNITITIN